MKIKGMKIRYGVAHRGFPYLGGVLVKQTDNEDFYDVVLTGTTEINRVTSIAKKFEIIDMYLAKHTLSANNATNVFSTQKE
ncbi:MAG: hypothetical protein KBT06_04480 [Prevotellaceae bacterium]|nr:hypothetical protein [Candidatus Colivivens equi]